MDSPWIQIHNTRRYTLYSTMNQLYLKEPDLTTRGYCEPDLTIRGYCEPDLTTRGYCEPDLSKQDTKNQIYSICTVRGYYEPDLSLTGYNEPDLSITGYNARYICKRIL